ncbi:MAG TPA: hypothetical protein VF549_12765 [Solirubrobacteraceae bacterium]
MRPLVLLCLAALALPGCSNTCPYGSTGQHGTDCKSRPEPSARERDGWHAGALRPRVATLRRRGVGRLWGVRVNRWGEVWATPAGGGRLVLDVGDHEVRDPKDDWDSAGHTPFSVRRVHADAVERAMGPIGRMARGMPFVDADLYDFGVGPRKGLKWYVTVGSGSSYRTWEADVRGRLLCELDRSDGTCP